ncbi:MAG: Helix-turn-helix domain [Moraxellaceae bacterium]|jgi:transcriptional regulator with XRE-family HTH domain|nr:Helix-turn-helix domain [Moraxellaceae bacterium]
MSESLGDYLKRLRVSRRLNQQSLAIRLCIGAPYLSRLEHGKKLYLNDVLMARLEEALSLSPEERQRLGSLRDAAVGRIPIAPDTSYAAVDLIKLMADAAPSLSEAQLGTIRESVQCMLKMIALTEDREMTAQK